MTINEIKRALEATESTALPTILQQFQNDERAGVKNLVGQYQKRLAKRGAEKQRLEGMLFFEKKYAGLGYGHICGVDEAGAGPLAGPVAAAAVILPEGCVIHGIDDSKKLSAKVRERLYHEIIKVAVAYHIAFVDHVEIDRTNILQARLKAMTLAVDGLAPRADFALVDGDRSPTLSVGCVVIQGGDSRSMSIAAASILAKVARDNVMLEYHKTYPQYGFDRHKGYGTAEHLAAMKQHGLTLIHRRTFLSHYADIDRRKRAGNYGENAAAGYLRARGYVILTQNYESGGGEIDIVAKDGGYIVFVEVKYRRQLAYGRPADAITAKKQWAMVAAAQCYLAENGLVDADCRFDVIEIFGRELLEINHIENAFGES